MNYDTRSYETRPSPARVSAEAATKVPRWALWGLLLTYVMTGLWTRAPWPQDDAAGFGVMVSMAQALLTHGILSHDSAAWWLPSVAGVYVTDEGPLAFWVGALLSHFLGASMGEIAATRLSCIVWFALAALSVWHSTRRLARRAEAQPIAFVFGGEASTQAYGRTLADIATLLFMGTVGIALRIHETSAEPAALAWLTVAVFGLVLVLDHPEVGSTVAGTALGLWMLTRGVAHAPFVAGAMALAIITTLQEKRLRALSLFVLSAAGMFALWPLAAFALVPEAATRFFDLWLHTLHISYGLPTSSSLAWMARNMPWYLWPLWPFAGWTLYSWRHALMAPHLRVPVCLVVAGLLATLFSATPSDASLILLIPPLAILAAFGATTLRRSADDSIDWMAIVVFSLFTCVVWAYYLALQTGVPIKMAASVARLTPGFDATFHVFAFVLAALATLGWLALVAWRLVRRPAVLWRGPLLAAGGTVMLWVVLSALFMPAMDFNRNYAPLAQQIAAEGLAQAGPQACFMPHRLTPAHLALFSYSGQVRFAKVDRGEICPLALHRDSRRTFLDDDPPPGDWQQVWEGGWPARPDETLRIYKRLAR